MATKRCEFCAKKLNEEGKCANEKCVDYFFEEVKQEIEKQKEEQEKAKDE